MYTIIVKTMHGLEEILQEELIDLGVEQTKILQRAVKGKADLSTIYKINYRSYFALRVLVVLKEVTLANSNDLYDEVKSIAWEEHFALEKTFAINAIAKTQLFNNSHFVALRAKDALADRFMAKIGKRPSVHIKQPDLRIHIHLFKNNLTISLDSSGESLHKRGYKIDSVPAPINEVLAAGLIKLSGWDYSTPLWDPMCGSGTFLCEALLQAYKNPAQDKHRNFAFKHWKNYDLSMWNQIVKEANQFIVTEETVKVYGSDIHPKAIRATQYNLAELGLLHHAELTNSDFFDHNNDGKAYHIIMNPPYDDRLELDDVIAFYKKIGDTFKSQCQGSTAWVVSAHIQALKRLGLRPSKKLTIFNGPNEARFHKFELYAGSKK